MALFELLFKYGHIHFTPRKMKGKKEKRKKERKKEGSKERKKERD